jgi:hypothetical protein
MGSGDSYPVGFDASKQCHVLLARQRALEAVRVVTALLEYQPARWACMVRLGALCASTLQENRSGAVDGRSHDVSQQVVVVGDALRNSGNEKSKRRLKSPRIRPCWGTSREPVDEVEQH